MNSPRSSAQSHGPEPSRSPEPSHGTERSPSPEPSHGPEPLHTVAGPDPRQSAGEAKAIRVTGAEVTDARSTDARSPDVRRTVARPTEQTIGTGKYLELAKLIRSSGLMRRRYGYYWTHLIALPVVYAACILLFLTVGDSWWQMPVAVLFAMVLTQTAFLGHDAAHRQIFRSGAWNEWATIVIGDLFTGMSYGWWNDKHTAHHDNPNQEGVDPDIDLRAIAFTPAQAAARRTPLTRWTARHQGVLFFPILFLEGVSLHVSSVRRVTSRKPIPRRWIEILFLTVRLGGYVALVLIVLSPGVALAFLSIQLGLFGFYMSMAFAPNHKGMPLVPKGLRLDFLSRQVAMSRNIRGNWAIDTAMGGLNYQIEHHLFPAMPRPSLRRARPIVRAYCDKHSIAYHEVPAHRAWVAATQHLNKVGIPRASAVSCPTAATFR